MAETKASSFRSGHSARVSGEHQRMTPRGGEGAEVMGVTGQTGLSDPSTRRNCLIAAPWWEPAHDFGRVAADVNPRRRRSTAGWSRRRGRQVNLTVPQCSVNACRDRGDLVMLGSKSHKPQVSKRAKR